MGWFWSLSDLPALPNDAHLAPLLAQHEFQEAFKNWRDLQFLARNLSQWQAKLAALRDMLANRRQAFAERLPTVRAKHSQIDLARAALESGELRRALAQAEADGDAAALADAQERALRLRLQRAGQSLQRLSSAAASQRAAGQTLAADCGPAATDVPGATSAQAHVCDDAERIRRVAGALLWQQTRQFPERLWRAKKALAELQRELALAQGREDALTKAQRAEPARLDDASARIDALHARLTALQPRVAELAAEQQTALQDIAIARLAQQKARLIAHVSQARFAVAQLIDRANLAAGKSHAEPR